MNKQTRKLFTDLVDAMEFHRDETIALPMAKYMKNKFAYLGIKQPVRKELSSDFLKAAKDLDGTEILALADALWEKEEREYQYVAIELLQKAKKKWDPSFIQFFLGLVTRKSWWDSVDFIAIRLIGAYYQDKTRPAKMVKWVRSENIWQNRTALLYQLLYKKETDTAFLFESIMELRHKKEFFIQKAIGWSLRHYYRTAPTEVEAFVEKSGLTGLAKREALKHA